MTTLDLSEYETAESAAKALHEYLNDEWDAGAILDTPEEAGPKNGGHEAWTVTWEGGPYKWAVNLTLETSMFAGSDIIEEGGEGPEVTGFYGHNNWIAEPHYSFNLQFSDQ